MRLGVVGGTFDPVHEGHLALAEAARACAGLDRVLLVPAAVPPHRPPATAPAADRLAMVRLAAAGRPGLEVSALEVGRAGPSYTLATLLDLRAAHPEAELYLVLGWDAARELRTWHRPEAVLALARLVIVARPGAGLPTERELQEAGIDPASAVLCAGPTPDVSATRVRALLSVGDPAAGLLAPAVARYIEEHGLYRGAARA